jgi:hypothetical protein
MYSIPDQKLYPSYQNFTLANGGSSEPFSWQVSKSGSFFAVTPGSGTKPTQIRVTPENFDNYQADTYQGSVTIDVTNPAQTAGEPHTTQINLMVVDSQIHQVFLPGILKQDNSPTSACIQH